MLEVHIPSVGPEAEDPRKSPEKGHMVFRVEVLCRGRRHTVQRRYSEFHALHKRIKKLYKVPDFPSKRLPNWRTRGLEQRRQGLEAYIQGVLYLNQDVPKDLLEFLSLRHFSTDPKASSWGRSQRVSVFQRLGGAPAKEQQLPTAPPACHQLPHGSLRLHSIPRASVQHGGEWRAPGPLWLRHQLSYRPARGSVSPCSFATGALTSPKAYGPPARTGMCLSVGAPFSGGWVPLGLDPGGPDPGLTNPRCQGRDNRG
ncbi:sorting nexin-22 isoform X1 [Hyaena hyaena]|uniref:sorting nexin-22 isoform X1 n=1 Tax=Hyaena hyaena TaxID=95912 RepID=UPI00192198B8|nr:sorting nexin-22 isoform X1 [Hyaena hyaena]